MPESDKAKLFTEAMRRDGLQAADIAYYFLVFLPLVTGIIGFAFWGRAILFSPDIPEDRLNPLLYASCVLMGVPVAGEFWLRKR
ncbi:hypothetical protein [Picosynechococcus sp. NKBG15041c]|uniref:hypothetical protein n=1 Tax=Picosynechococcus sp. NKBG15041c TaxID=1407650 RepID=UPI00042013D9|nr:hypothetical protein [Picosynechococcus sp. NKBG15041c]